MKNRYFKKDFATFGVEQSKDKNAQFTFEIIKAFEDDENVSRP